MKLLVVRHGPAGDPEAWKAEGRDDRLRPLTPDGKKAMRQATAGLGRLIRRVDVIISSPLVRATQTAEIVAERYNISRERQDEYALQSQQRTAAGQREGRVAEEIVPLPSHDD